MNIILLDIIRRPIKKYIVYINPIKIYSAEFAIEYIINRLCLHRPSRKESKNQRNIDIKFTALAAELSNSDLDLENRYIRYLDK